MLVTLSSTHLPGQSGTGLIAGTSTTATNSTAATQLDSPSVTHRTRKISFTSSLRSDSIFSLSSSLRTVTAFTSPHPSLASSSSLVHSNTTTFPQLRTASSAGSMMNVFSSSEGNQKRGLTPRARAHSAAGMGAAPAVLSQSPVEDGGVSAADAVNDTIVETLQRHASSSQGSASLSLPVQARKMSVRVVGRGGQGSRPRRAKTPPINPRDQILSPTSPSVNNAVHPPTRTAGTSEGSKAGVRVVGRGGFGSKRRVPVANSELLPPQHSDSINSVHHHPPPAGPTGTIRVSGRGGAGSRPRALVAASSFGTKPKMQFIRMKWKGRKKSMPNMVIAGSDSPVSPSSPMRFAPTHTRAATLPIDPLQSALSKQDSDRPLPPIPPSPAGSTIELSSTYSTNTSLSVFLHSSDSHPSAPASPRSRRNTGSKLERTLGDPVPTALLFSTGGNRSFDTHATSGNQSSSHYKRNRSKSKSRRRASISLSSLGSFMRLPRESSSVLHHAGSSKAAEQQDDRIWDDAGSLYNGSVASCWVDNKFESQSREGAVTPVSPMIFSDRPESPKPPKSKLPNGSTGDHAETSSIASIAASFLDNHDDIEVADADDQDPENEDDDSFLRTPPTASDIVPLTPHSLSDSQTDIISPIIFSDRPVSMFMPSTSDQEELPLRASSDDELDISIESRRSEFSTPRLKSRLLRDGADTNYDSFVRPDSPFIDSGVPMHSIHARLHHQDRSAFPLTQRSESSQGWSGEWNRNDLQEVIQSLRELR